MKRTPFDIALLVFVGTAVIGILVAYNRMQAGIKFLNLIGAILLYYLLAGQRRRDIWRASGALGAVGSAIAAYFLLTHDWRAWPADIGLLTRLGVQWMGIRPSLSLPAIHPNSAGGLIAVLLPFQVAFGVYGWRKRRPRIWRLALILGGITLAGFLLTSSRAAWLSLAAAIGAGVLWLMSGRVTAVSHRPRRTTFSLLLVAAVVLGIGFSFIIADGPLSLLGRLPGRDNVTSRLDLFQQTLGLIADFPFTGGGLAAFPGLYSQYIAVTPFFQFNYSHNLWLDVTLEQTVLGALALIWMTAGSGLLLWRTVSAPRLTDGTDAALSPAQIRRHQFRSDLNLFRWAALAGLIVMALHSLVDDALYGGVGTPLLLVLPGMAVAVARKWEVRRLTPSFVLIKSRVALIIILLLAGVGANQSIASAWYANLGAVKMARTELAGWPTRQWADGRNAAALLPAEALFQQAVQINPNNRTAHYRLGLAAMLRREYETAVTHLEAAYALDSDHRGIVKSLGYSYVWVGDLEKAAVLLENIPEARREMTVYSRWWGRQGRPDLAARAAEMIVALAAV